MAAGRVHLYALCWNEIRILPFFLRHYRPFVDRFFVLDDGSTDGSRELLAQQSDVTLIDRSFRETDSFVSDACTFYNEAWKASRGSADWVVVCNVDEHLYHPSMSRY